MTTFALSLTALLVAMERAMSMTSSKATSKGTSHANATASPSSIVEHADESCIFQRYGGNVQSQTSSLQSLQALLASKSSPWDASPTILQLAAPSILALGGLIAYTGQSWGLKMLDFLQVAWEAELSLPAVDGTLSVEQEEETHDHHAATQVVYNQGWQRHAPMADFIDAAVSIMLSSTPSLEEICPAAYSVALVLKMEIDLSEVFSELHLGEGVVDLRRWKDVQAMWHRSFAERKLQDAQGESRLERVALVGQHRVASMLAKAEGWLGDFPPVDLVALATNLSTRWLGLDHPAFFAENAPFQEQVEAYAPPDGVLGSGQMHCLNRTPAMRQMEMTLPGPSRLFWHHMADVYHAWFDWRVADLGAGVWRKMLWQGTALLERELDFVWQHCAPAAAAVVLLRTERWLARMMSADLWRDVALVGDPPAEVARRIADAYLDMFRDKVRPLVYLEHGDEVPQRWATLLYIAHNRVQDRVQTFFRTPSNTRKTRQIYYDLERYSCLSAMGVGTLHLLAAKPVEAAKLVAAGQNHSQRTASRLPGVEKLAFLFMVYEQLTFPSLWRRFFEDAETTTYKISVHASGRQRQDAQASDDALWFDQFLIPKQPSRWSNMSRVFFGLFEDALSDPAVARAFFISQDTIPLARFGRIHRFAATAHHTSWLCMDHEVTRSEPYSMISTRHMQLLMEHKAEVLEMQRGMGCCDAEDMIPQALYLLGEQSRIEDRCVTFTQWALPKYFAVGRRASLGMPPALSTENIRIGGCGHPTLFLNLTHSHVQKLLEDVSEIGHWFARKFAREAVVTNGNRKDVPLERYLLSALYGVDGPG